MHVKPLVSHGCCGQGPQGTAGRRGPLGLAPDARSPDQVSEASVQVHAGGRAAEHGQNALQVQELQLLTVTAEEQTRSQTHTKSRQDSSGEVGRHFGKYWALQKCSLGVGGVVSVMS